MENNKSEGVRWYTTQEASYLAWLKERHIIAYVLYMANYPNSSPVQEASKETTIKNNEDTFEEILVPSSGINCQGLSEDRRNEIAHSMKTELPDLDLGIDEHTKETLIMKNEYLEGEIDLFLSFIKGFFKRKDFTVEQEYVKKLENFIDKAETCDISKEVIERCYQYYGKIKKREAEA